MVVECASAGLCVLCTCLTAFSSKTMQRPSLHASTRAIRQMHTRSRTQRCPQPTRYSRIRPHPTFKTTPTSHTHTSKLPVAVCQLCDIDVLQLCLRDRSLRRGCRRRGPCIVRAFVGLRVRERVCVCVRARVYVFRNLCRVYACVGLSRHSFPPFPRNRNRKCPRRSGTLNDSLYAASDFPHRRSQACEER